MKIGIMGGTFNPIHNGHLMLGEYAHKEFNLDEVWFMPNGNPPHKDDPSIVDDKEDRAVMTELAIKDIPYFRLCRKELDRIEKSYSYSTMEDLTTEYPDDEFYFIIGADSLFSIETWKNPERLFKVVTILAACRDDMNDRAMAKQIEYLKEKYHCRIHLLRTPMLDVSSHEIRSHITNHTTEELLIPPLVLEYITQKHLYQITHSVEL